LFVFSLLAFAAIRFLPLLRLSDLTRRKNEDHKDIRFLRDTRVQNPARSFSDKRKGMATGGVGRVITRV